MKIAEFEIENDDSFTVVTNNILRNKDLSMSAKGLLCTIFSLPPEWDYSFNGLVSICKEGKAAVRNAINELKEVKYIKISQFRNAKGYYQYKYTVYRKPYEERQINEFHPTPGYRMSDYRKSDNQPQLNTNKLNTKELKDNIDNIDKTSNQNLEHHYLTKELFKKRKTTVERSFGDSKQNHGYRYTLFKGVEKNQAYTHLICAAQNMKNIAIKRTNIDEKVYDSPIFIDIFVEMTEKIKMYIKENPTFFQMRGLSTL